MVGVKHLDPILIELKETVLSKCNESFFKEKMGCLGTKENYVCGCLWFKG